uniref:Uncharacterized protein n=1 Tax=uncultured Desulfobacterium sp. TaxID=201089 RepID=E1YLB2_9BACT|nr:unknown protein [uncultured Desulfobacterium sp.]
MPGSMPLFGIITVTGNCFCLNLWIISFSLSLIIVCYILQYSYPLSTFFPAPSHLLLIGNSIHIIIMIDSILSFKLTLTMQYNITGNTYCRRSNYKSNHKFRKGEIVEQRY